MVKVKKSGKSQAKSKGAVKRKKSAAQSWPQQRKIMFRPERYKYVRKLIKENGCVFCNALAKGAKPESLILWKNDNVMVMLNKFPYNSGHLMVLPTRHCGDLTQLSDIEFDDLQRLLKKALSAVVAAYDCGGVNLGLNHGKAAGAGIPDHLHWHIVPRWNGDTNFFPVIAETKALVETLEQAYDRLKGHFN